MDLDQVGEIKEELAVLTSLVTMNSTTHINFFGEIKQMIISLMNLVASAMEVSHLEDNGEEKWRNRGSGQRLSPLDRARARVRHIFSESTYAHPLCLRCGGEGHIAKHCCKSLVCFACEKIGHKSRDCTEITKSHTHVKIGGDGERQGIHKSQWIWKKKDNKKQEENEKLKDDAIEKHKTDAGSKNVMSFAVVPVQSNVISVDTKGIECTESKEEMRSAHQKEKDNPMHTDEAYMGQGQYQYDFGSSSKNCGFVENENNLQIIDLGVDQKLDQRNTSIYSGDSKILREIEIHGINSFKEAGNEIEVEKLEADEEEENTRVQKVKKGKSKKKKKKERSDGMASYFR